ncbi:MAG: DNA methyltransferase [Patescibacteria group bacterium]
MEPNSLFNPATTMPALAGREINIAPLGATNMAREFDGSWDFRGAKTKSYTHGLHSYPAMFIPQVARRLVQSYSRPGDKICDIFCGSGTTLVESIVLGRDAIGIDLNPLAVFLAKVKTTPINPSLLTKAYFHIVEKYHQPDIVGITIPEFPNLNFWFNETTIAQLAKLKYVIRKTTSGDTRDFFMATFSEVVRLVSNTKNGEFKLVRMSSEKLRDWNPNVLNMFRKKAENNIAGMSDFFHEVPSDHRATIIIGDSSQDNKIPKNSIDLILTSPPYGDSRTTVAYGQFSRLSSQWIDLFEDPSEASKVDNQLLGGNKIGDLSHNLQSVHLIAALETIAQQDISRAKEVLSFFIGLNRCVEQAHSILKPNRHMCVVIGNRLVKQVRIPTDIIIAELGNEIGFTCETIMARNIPGKKMPIRNSPTNIAGQLADTMNQESIVVLRKLK